MGSLPGGSSGETVLQFLFRRLGDLLGPALHEFEIVLGGMDVILQHPELLCGPLDPGKPLLLLPDPLLDLLQPLFLPGQLPDAAGDQVLKFLCEAPPGLPLNELRQIIRKADAADVGLRHAATPLTAQRRRPG